MQTVASTAAAHVAFTELLDLASERVGGKALSTSDDFFAEKENLLKASAPVFVFDKYTDRGKWMDGWESRRKRNLKPGNDHDWCVVQLGVPGIIRGVNIDTSFFTGNFPEAASLEACAGDPDRGPWKELIPRTRLQGGSHNLVAVADPGTWTHVRLRIFPDGGVARLRVHGEATPDLSRAPKESGRVDLAAASNGGCVVACNDSFFGPKDNLILPGRAENMGQGWETRRRRGPGHDWIVVRLAARGKIGKIEVDTNHFKGNFPESCSIDACSFSGRDLTATDLRDRQDLVWKPILPRTVLQADHRHYFEKELTGEAGAGPWDYVRLTIYPDGGVSRLRVWGTA
ncbi:MAG TPA: allantoicase [Bdellovibrionota bacterium]|nr:allantoicase [Bdellovibrionota bacterium]